jgi:DNA-binding transcriptional ArsR family regulator
MGLAVNAVKSTPRSSSWLGVIADPIRLHIMSALSQVTEATAAEIADEALASPQTLRRHLEALVAFGVIDERPGESDGETRGRPAARFSLSTEVRASVRLVLRAESWLPQRSRLAASSYANSTGM